MSEKFSYPDREHLQPIETFSDALEFELSIHEEGEDFRRGIVTISKLYKDTAILRSYLLMSRLLALSHVLTGHEQCREKFDIDFYRGAIIGMHCALRVSSPAMRQQIVHTDVLRNYFDTEEFKYEYDSEVLKTYAEQLRKWLEAGVDESFSSENPASQVAIQNAASHAYEDVGNQSLFIAGVMMAKDVTEYLTSVYADSNNHIIPTWKGAV